MLAERCPDGSTSGTALVYAVRMNARNFIVPALLLLVADSVGCKDETPPNTPGEFGDPCIPGENGETPDGCVTGLECYKGYCEETCTADSDCQPVEGWDHTCVAGLCQIWCEADDECPQSLGAPLTCGVMGSAMWCRADDEES